METKQSVDVGEVVRRLREKANLSVRTLAAKSGFSASFISQVENGQSSPSISSLERIAGALGVTLVEFFQATADQGPAIVKRHQRVGMSSGWSRATIELLGAGSALEPLLVTINSGGMSSKTPAARDVDQFAMVIDGTVMISLEEQTDELERGDAVTIPAGVRHCWRNTKASPAQILLVATRHHRRMS